ncbi:serine/threonine-protein kinase [Chloropicon primus]|nr:serine/threonine-protein kinase [Chloropicon primus]
MASKVATAGALLRQWKGLGTKCVPRGIGRQLPWPQGTSGVSPGGARDAFCRRYATAEATRGGRHEGRAWVKGLFAVGSLGVGGGLVAGTTVYSRDAKGKGVEVESGSQVVSGITNGLARSAVFYWYALPIYTQYKLTEWWFDGTPFEDSEYYWDLLHDRHCGTVEYVCLLLKGFYLKGAQVASTRDDLLPQQYLAFCKKFQDEVPTELAGREELERTICSSLGIKDIHEVFECIDSTPVGAASIGVVHRAKLRDGRVVAVKVQFPDIEERFRNDLKTVKRFCSFALPSHMPFLDEIERQFLTEFDYRGEAENLERIRKDVLPGWKRHVYIPYVVKDLCTKEVMVMEYLEGTNLLKSLVKQYERYAAKQGLTLKELAEKSAGEGKGKGGGSKATSLAVQGAKMYVAEKVAQLRDLGLNLPRFLYNLTLGWVPGWAVPYRWSERPINLARVLDILMQVHAHEIFRHGFFNADPHPGNIMLLKDGRIGLIDYGQVKQLSLEKRVEYAKLVVYLAKDKRKSAVLQATEGMGLVTKNMNHQIIYRTLAFFHDRDTDDVTGGKNIQQFMDWCNAEDPILDLDDDYVLVGRVSLLLRGLGNAFNLKLRVTQYWRSEAERLLRSAGVRA